MNNRAPGPLPADRPPMRRARHHILPLLLLLATAAGTLGCEKARLERAHREEMAKIGLAIEQYSTASDAANGAHKDVIAAFAAANASANLPEYKAALRTKVLPAMDEFIARLAKMPTGNPDLKKIHDRLTEAYRRARDEIADFEKGLQDAKGLSRFDDIRAGLQRAVTTYRDQLAAYYQSHERQLRKDTGKELPADASATTLPSPASATTPPATAPTLTDGVR